MKKVHILVTAALLTLALCGTLYAKYIKGFVVVDKTENTVVIKDKNDVEISVETQKTKKFKVGDKVKYDETKHKLKLDKKPTRPPEGC